jgi:PAS domain S-box-containing protein
MLDVELAIINDAYGAEYLRREKCAEHERGEMRFRTLVEAAACMVVIVRLDHRIVYFGSYSEELTGFSARDAVGNDFVALFVPDSARESVRHELNSAATGSAVNTYECPILRRQGDVRWLVWNARRLEDFDSSPAILAVGHDLTEQREAQARLLQSERLAAIGQMITGIAHESRNALQRIQACSEMLELEVEGKDEPLRLLHRLQSAQDSLIRLFDEVRTYAAPIHLEQVACQLPSTWREAWQMLEPVWTNRDVRLIEMIDGINLNISVDRFRMVQVFRNLFENALAASSDPTVIEVDSREVHWEGRPAVEISFRDNGGGFTPESMRCVFDPFFTTKTKGTGLGMAIARRIVEAHGGEIRANSRARGGAEFVLILPRMPL